MAAYQILKFYPTIVTYPTSHYQIRDSNSQSLSFAVGTQSKSLEEDHTPNPKQSEAAPDSEVNPFNPRSHLFPSRIMYSQVCAFAHASPFPHGPAPY